MSRPNLDALRARLEAHQESRPDHLEAYREAMQMVGGPKWRAWRKWCAEKEILKNKIDMALALRGRE